MAAERPPLLTLNAAAPGEVFVDLERLLVSRLLIQASSGAGKSWALRYLLEQTQSRVQQLILDVEGEFASLREIHPYLLVGRQGEIPAVPAQAHVLARRLMALGSSAIIDLSELKAVAYTLPDGKTVEVPGREVFVKHFLEGLIDLPQTEWHSVLVVLDEVQRFAPESGRGRSVSKSAVIDMATLGRKRGQALGCATQRIASVSNDVLAELQNKLVGGTYLDTDVARASKDLGFRGNAQDVLRTLEPGQFFAVGPAIAKQPVLVRTGLVRTTHPRPGEVVPPAPPTPDAIRALVGQLSDLSVTTAEDLDLEGARARILDLEQRLSHVLASPRVERVEVPVLKAQQVEAMLEVTRRLEAAAADVKRVATFVDDVVLRVQAELAAPPLPLPPAAPAQPVAPIERTSQAHLHRAAKPPVKRVSDVSETEPTLTQRPSRGVDGASIGRLILEALGKLRGLGLPSVVRPQLAVFSGYADPTTRSWRDALALLKEGGLVEYPSGGRVSLTAAGMANVSILAVPYRTPWALHVAWYAVLGEDVRSAVLRALVGAYPEGVTRAKLAEVCGYSDPTTRSFRDAVADLRQLGLATVPERGTVAATEVLFPPIKARGR